MPLQRGSRYELTVPPTFDSYGASWAGSVRPFGFHTLPANETLVYDIEVIDWDEGAKISAWNAAWRLYKFRRGKNYEHAENISENI